MGLTERLRKRRHEGHQAEAGAGCKLFNPKRVLCSFSHSHSQKKSLLFIIKVFHLNYFKFMFENCLILIILNLDDYVIMTDNYFINS